MLLLLLLLLIAAYCCLLLLIAYCCCCCLLLLLLLLLPLNVLLLLNAPFGRDEKASTVGSPASPKLPGSAGPLTPSVRGVGLLPAPPAPLVRVAASWPTNEDRSARPLSPSQAEPECTTEQK